MMVVAIISCNNKDSKTSEVKAISKDSLVKRGAYFVSVSGCDDCHTPKKMGPMGARTGYGSPFIRLSFAGSFPVCRQ